MKVGQQLDNARRDLYVAAALNEQGKSRVDESKIREALLAALTEGDLSLRTFKSGSVGIQVRVNVPVSNESDEEFDLRGQILLTIPETVVKS